MRYYTAVVLTLSLVAFGGSRTTGATQQATTAAIAPLHAGAFRVDITPPPGLSTGGHGPAGAIARGHLTRLYARAIYLTDGLHPLLLVSVESFAVTPAFQLEIHKRVPDDVGKPLPLASIIVSATHTPHGPRNYLGAKVYNEHASRVPGYIPKLREFLVNHIVEAANQAIKNAEGTNPVSIELRRGVFRLEALRNRSPETFILNRDADDVMKQL